MANWSVSGVRLAGVASAVPEPTRSADDLAALFGPEDSQKIVDSVGVQTRHIAGDSTCTSDLCEAAAARILADLGWSPGSIDALVLVTQTPDYVLPATACSLHQRLGMGPHCLAFDVNQGCSGYVYGLAVVSRLLGAGTVKRALLLAGDTLTRLVSPVDRSAAPLFGDAGTATALECDDSAPEMFFDLGTDGAGVEHLLTPAGGFRTPRSPQTTRRTERENGNIRSDADLFMDGGEVFMFTLSSVPGLVKRTLKGAGWERDNVDAVVLHQANAFMLGHLRKRLKLSEEQFPVALSDYGNTASASIPLAMSHSWASESPMGRKKLVLGGFGTGWSWAGAAIESDGLVLPEVIVVPDQEENSIAWSEAA